MKSAEMHGKGLAKRLFFLGFRPRRRRSDFDDLQEFTIFNVKRENEKNFRVSQEFTADDTQEKSWVSPRLE